MKVDKLSVGKIFDATERAEAPLFQRPYVWEQEQNWQPLWESLRDVAERLLVSHTARPHFLGAIVLDQLNTQAGRIHIRQIIDGQQRLTTLQLLLAVIRDYCASIQETKYSQAFGKLIENDVPLSDDPIDKFKIWPTNADQQEFQTVMTSFSLESVQRIAKAGSSSWSMTLAYIYFYDELREWVGNDAASRPIRLDALYRTIRDNVLLVVIDLDDQDDAQEIFETLNALGTPLLTADLVKNFLFRQAERANEDTRKLYERFWAEFDEEKGYWRAERRQGRLKRPTIELFLHHYLTLQTTQEINISHVFTTYKGFVLDAGLPASKQLAIFKTYADVFRSFDNFVAGSREELFFYRLDQLDTTTVYPLLLELFKRFHGAEGLETIDQIITDLESYFVRRAVCELTSKNYNKFFVQVIKALKEKGDFSPAAIRTLLLNETSDTTKWPNDQEFSDAWLSARVFRKVKRSKVRMILEALESSMHTGKTESLRIPRDLTIEHLMPQHWERHWPLAVAIGSGNGATKEAGEIRESLIDTFGNLTLLTKELNPAVSNGPWEKKKPEILKHSALNLNRQLPEVWDENEILVRSDALYKQALKLWPRAQAVATAVA